MPLNPGKGLKTNKRDSGILVQRDTENGALILPAGDQGITASSFRYFDKGNLAGVVKILSCC